MAEKKEVLRAPTGIEGFDEKIDGGFVRNNCIVLSGGPGVGKTIFSLQFIWNGALKKGEKALFLTCEQPIESLKMQARQFGWDFDKVKDKVKFFHIPTHIGKYPLLEKIKEQYDQLKPDRIVLDNISSLALSWSMYDLKLSEEDTQKTYDMIAKVRMVHLSNPEEQFVSILITKLRELSSTIIIIATAPKEIRNYYTRDGVSEFVCDALLHFEEVEYSVSEFNLGFKIVKMRNTKFARKKNPFHMRIGDEGIEVLKHED